MRIMGEKAESLGLRAESKETGKKEVRAAARASADSIAR